LYELLCHQPAFLGDDDKEVLGAIIARDPIKPRKIENRVPHELETICLKTLEKSPEARYSTARALAEDLRRYIHDLPIVAKRPGIFRRSFKFVRRHRAPVIAIAAAILLTAAGITLVHLKAESEAAQIRELRTRVNSLVDRGISIGQIARESNELHEWDAAEAKLREALRNDPDHLKSMLAYVWLRIERFKLNPDLKTNENLEELDGWCRRVLEREPESITALNYHGIVLKDLGRLEEAIQVAARIVDLDESDFPGWSNLGAYYALAGNLARAEECLQEGARLARDAEEFNALYRAQAWRALAAVHLHLQHESAVAHIEQAISLTLDDIPSLILKARVLLQRGAPNDHAQALEVAGYAVYLSAGNDPRAKRIKALAHLRNGQFVQAIDHAEAAIQLGDMAAVNHLIIAVAEARRGNKIGAEDHLEDADKVWPGELKKTEFVATYNEGILWFESRAELEGLRAQADRIAKGRP
jgi:tetratricopeptide (TPR) repeat protein